MNTLESNDDELDAEIAQLSAQLEKLRKPKPIELVEENICPCCLGKGFVRTVVEEKVEKKKKEKSNAS